MSPGAGGEGLGRLRALLRERGGLVAAFLHGEPVPPASRPAALVRRGPRASAHPLEYELLTEAIYEGYLLHYGRSRLLRVPAEEEELGLLAGDQLYAIGLARLVEIGDTLAVSELADTITLGALAQACGSEPLADAVWRAGARAVGWGPSERHDAAKQAAREGRPEALEAMRTSAGG